MNRYTLIAEDYSTTIEGYRQILSKSKAETGILVTEKTARGALSRIERHSFDLVVTDLEFCDENRGGLDIIRAASAPTIAHSRFRRRRWVQAARIAGADGYVLKDPLGTDLGEAAEAVLNGKTWFENILDIVGLDTWSETPLKARHYDALRAIGKSATAEEAASQLNVTRQTVYNYRQEICNSLHLESTAEIDRLAEKLT